MNYSTWEKSRWFIYDYPDTDGMTYNNKIRIAHLELDFKIIYMLDGIDEFIKLIVLKEEMESNKKVSYKEKLELKKCLKKLVKNYINNRLRNGFEHEIFIVQ